MNEPKLVGIVMVFIIQLFSTILRMIEKRLNDMKWKSDKNSELETEVNEVLVRLARLNSQSVNTIDFDKQYKYYTQSKRDSSTLYLIYIEEEKRLYILEDLL